MRRFGRRRWYEAPPDPVEYQLQARGTRDPAQPETTRLEDYTGQGKLQMTAARE